MNISKYRSQLFASWEQFTAHLRQAQNALVGMGRNAAERLNETFRPRVNDLRQLLASSHDAMAEANGKIAKYRSQLLAAWEKFTVHLRQAQAAFVGLGRKAVERPRETFSARANNLRDDLRDLRASSHDAVALANGKITKSRSQLFAAWEKLKVYLRQSLHALAGLGRKVVEKPRRLQKALRTKENNLRKLLANSLDPIVVMDVGRRLVAANPKALDLFGVSETNLKKFTIDAFLSGNEVLFSGNGSPFKGRVEKHGECKIRRLDGSARVAEYVFVANFAPYQHLCRFCNVRTAHIKSFAFSSGHGNDSNTARLH
jgi:PAS domain-containing protein